MRVELSWKLLTGITTKVTFRSVLDGRTRVIVRHGDAV